VLISKLHTQINVGGICEMLDLRGCESVCCITDR